MNATRIILASLLMASFLATLAWERKAQNAARREQAALTMAAQEADRFLAESTQFARPPGTAPKDRAASLELLRLRNEVRQLRLLAPEADRLRAENARLSAPGRPPDPAAK